MHIPTPRPVSPVHSGLTHRSHFSRFASNLRELFQLFLSQNFLKDGLRAWPQALACISLNSLNAKSVCDTELSIVDGQHKTFRLFDIPSCAEQASSVSHVSPLSVMSSMSLLASSPSPALCKLPLVSPSPKKQSPHIRTTLCFAGNGSLQVYKMLV